MQRKKLNQLIVYQFEIFPDDTITAITTTRHGGISKDIRATLDVGTDQSSPEEANQNRKILADSLDIPLENMVFASQSNSDNIAVVTKEMIGKYHLHPDGIPDTDAMITNTPEICLVVKSSDCVPIVFYDPVNQPAGVCHAGWQGTLNKIATKTVRKMHSTYGSKPKDILAGIGPSIGPCCFEVSNSPKSDVITKTKEEFPTHHTILLSTFTIQKNGRTKAHLDLWEANRINLLEAGVLPKNIEISKICTKCNQEEFFSFRENPSRGNFATLIKLGPHPKPTNPQYND